MAVLNQQIYRGRRPPPARSVAVRLHGDGSGNFQKGTQSGGLEAVGSRGKFFYGYEGRSLPEAEAKRHSAVHILATAQLLKPAHSQIHVAFVFRGFFSHKY